MVIILTFSEVGIYLLIKLQYLHFKQEQRQILQKQKELMENFKSLNVNSSLQITNQINSKSSLPSLFLKEGYTWQDIHGKYHSCIENCLYSVGDISPYGQIVYISELKVYAQDDKTINIIRLCPAIKDAEGHRPSASFEQEQVFSI